MTGSAKKKKEKKLTAAKLRAEEQAQAQTTATAEADCSRQRQGAPTQRSPHEGDYYERLDDSGDELSRGLRFGQAPARSSSALQRQQQQQQRQVNHADDELYYAAEFYAATNRPVTRSLTAANNLRSAIDVTMGTSHAAVIPTFAHPAIARPSAHVREVEPRSAYHHLPTTLHPTAVLSTEQADLLRVDTVVKLCDKFKNGAGESRTLGNRLKIWLEQFMLAAGSARLTDPVALKNVFLSQMGTEALGVYKTIRRPDGGESF